MFRSAHFSAYVVRKLVLEPLESRLGEPGGAEGGRKVSGQRDIGSPHSQNLGENSGENEDLMRRIYRIFVTRRSSDSYLSVGCSRFVVIFDGSTSNHELFA